MKRVSLRRSKPAGFTLVELMIAIAVFSVVLLLVTTAILQITRLYYKGVTSSKTQNTTRTIVDLVAQGIQFSGDPITTTAASPTPGSSYAFCVGDKQFSYTTGYQLADSPTASQTYHALVMKDLPSCSTSTSGPQNVRNSSVTGRELLAPGMRLSKMNVTNIGTDLYKINVKVVSGDSVLLSNPTLANAACLGVRQGTQFCSISELTTVVTKRVK